MRSKGSAHKVNSFFLTAFIVLLAAVAAALCSSGVFSFKKTKAEAVVFFKSGGKSFMYSPESGVCEHEVLKLESDEDEAELFLKEKNGTYYFEGKSGAEALLEIENILLETVSVSYDKRNMAFLDSQGSLYFLDIKGDKPESYMVIDENVEQYSFTGTKNDIVFMGKDGSLSYFSERYKKKEESKVKKFQVSNSMNVFYIRNDGIAVMFNVGKKAEIDTDVYDIKFINGMLFYIKERNGEQGDLYYFDGKDSFAAGVKAESFLD